MKTSKVYPRYEIEARECGNDSRLTYAFNVIAIIV